MPIEFTPDTNKVIVNTKLAMPELREKIINFADHMYRDYETPETECYAIVTSIGWDDDAYELTDAGVEYLKSIVAPYVKEEILQIDIQPENSDNIYDICAVWCSTENYIYDFKAKYVSFWMEDKPYVFKRTYTRSERNRIYPYREESIQIIQECNKMLDMLKNQDYNNPMVQKLLKAIKEKGAKATKKSWQMDEQAFYEIRGNIPDELFDMS